MGGDGMDGIMGETWPIDEYPEQRKWRTNNGPDPQDNRTVLSLPLKIETLHPAHHVFQCLIAQYESSLFFPWHSAHLILIPLPNSNMLEITDRQ
jgi:hypothetical protein